jgi:hypothetical protein
LAERERHRKTDKIGVGVGIGIGVEKEIGMAFGHEKLDSAKRGYAVHEETKEYRTSQIDPDTDTDPDPERKT